MIGWIKSLFSKGIHFSWSWRFGNGKKYNKAGHKKFDKTISTYEDTKAKKDSTIYKRR